MAGFSGEDPLFIVSSQGRKRAREFSGSPHLFALAALGPVLLPLVLVHRACSLAAVHGLRCSGVSGCAAQVLGMWASVAAAHRLSSAAHRL